MTKHVKFLCASCKQDTTTLEDPDQDSIRTGCPTCNQITTHIQFHTLAFSIRFNNLGRATP